MMLWFFNPENAKSHNLFKRVPWTLFHQGLWAPGLIVVMFRSSPEVTTHMDDEYAWAGVEDPKIVMTTSHNPSSRLKQFAKVRGCKCFPSSTQPMWKPLALSIVL